MWHEVPDAIINETNKKNETLDKKLMNYVMFQLGFIQDFTDKRTRSNSSTAKASCAAQAASASGEKGKSGSTGKLISFGNPIIQDQLYIIDIKQDQGGAQLSPRAYSTVEKQTIKMQSLWVILGGDHYGHVTLNNLRMLMLAIKGLHVQPEVPLN